MVELPVVGEKINDTINIVLFIYWQAYACKLSVSLVWCMWSNSNQWLVHIASVVATVSSMSLCHSADMGLSLSPLRKKLPLFMPW